MTSGAASSMRWWSGIWIVCTGSRGSWRSSSTSAKRLGCRSWPRSAAMLTCRRTTASSWLVSSGLWQRRRATTRAAGSGVSKRSWPRRARSQAAAHAPYGYEDDKLTVRESEAFVIRECAAPLLAGEALRSICADLNDRGVPTSTGGQWQAQTLRRMLRSARISGQREHKGEIVAEAEWPAIISSGRDNPDPGAAVGSGSAHEQSRPPLPPRPAPALRPLRRDARLPAEARRGTRLPQCVKGPGFSGCGRFIRDGRPARAVRRRSRPLPARLARARSRDERRTRRPRRGTLASRDRAVPPTAGRACRDVRPPRDRNDRMAGSPHPDRTPRHRREETARPADPLHRPRWPDRPRNRATRTLANPAPNPTARDRRRRPRPHHRRTRPARLQQLRPEPLHARSGAPDHRHQACWGRPRPRPGARPQQPRPASTSIPPSTDHHPGSPQNPDELRC